MSTIYSHAVVGLALGGVCVARRIHWAFWVLVGFLPVLPDFDTFGTAVYGSTLGHRGFTHSLAFALVIGLVVAGVSFRFFRVSFWFLWALFFAVTASHGIMDAFTDGGYGIPLLWPLSSHRFGPWGPLPLPDVGFEVPDPWVNRSVRRELLYIWLPTAALVVVVVEWRRRRK